MKTYKFDGNYGKVKCKYFFDADLGTEGIDVSVDNIHIGEYFGMSIPDEEDNIIFEKEIENWLDSSF